MQGPDRRQPYRFSRPGIYGWYPHRRHSIVVNNQTEKDSHVQLAINNLKNAHFYLTSKTLRDDDCFIEIRQAIVKALPALQAIRDNVDG